MIFTHSDTHYRLLGRTLLAMSLIVLSLSTVFAVETSPTDIVFIAEDANDIDQIWLTNTSELQNFLQMTDHDTPVLTYQLAEDKPIVLYRTAQDDGFQIWLLDLATGEFEPTSFCEGTACLSYVLHPNGDWVVTTIYKAETATVAVTLHDLTTDESRTLYDYAYDRETANALLPPSAQWVDDTIVAFHTQQESGDFIFYDVVQDEIVTTRSLNIGSATPHFTADGEYFWHYSENADAMMTGNMPFSLRQTVNPQDTLLSFNETTESGQLERMTFQDWSPTTTEILVSGIRQVDGALISEISTYNFVTGTQYVWVTATDGVEYTSVSFNSDGSQLAYTIVDPNVSNSRVAIHSLVTNEVNMLPLTARYPQWIQS